MSISRYNEKENNWNQSLAPPRLIAPFNETRVLFKQEKVADDELDTDLNLVVDWSERKTLINIIYFLTRFWNPVEINDPEFVYIGPTIESIAILEEMFPNFKFHYYFSNSTLESKSKNVIIYNVPIEEQDIEQWLSKSRRKKLFMYFNYDINLQKDLYLQIEPLYANLSFDLSLLDGDNVEYLDGVLVKQPWDSLNSQEYRLITNTKNTKSYDLNDHIRNLMYHNLIVRQQYIYTQPFLDSKLKYIGQSNDELINDFDSNYEILVLKFYLVKYRLEKSWTNVKTLSSYITNSLDPKLNLNQRRKINQ